MKELLFFIILSLFAYSKESNSDCGTPAECYVQAKSLLERDRKEMREIRDRMISENEAFKKQIIPIGTIVYHISPKVKLDNSDLPVGWTECDGKALLRKEYSELFSIIGVFYGAGDGTNTFNIPDLSGRTVVASGNGNGLSTYLPGQKGGEETHQITVEEMPAHFHLQGSESVYNFFGGGMLIGGRVYSIGDFPAYQYQFTKSEGGSKPHNNISPYISLHAILKIK